VWGWGRAEGEGSPSGKSRDPLSIDNAGPGRAMKIILRGSHTPSRSHTSPSPSIFPPHSPRPPSKLPPRCWKLTPNAIVARVPLAKSNYTADGHPHPGVLLKSCPGISFLSFQTVQLTSISNLQHGLDIAPHTDANCDPGKGGHRC